MSKKDLKIGDKTADGSTYVGVSEETGEALFVLGEKRLAHGENLDDVERDLAAQGLRLPTGRELPAVMKALNIASGREDKPDPTRMYWSGERGPDQQEVITPLRVVRYEP